MEEREITILEFLNGNFSHEDGLEMKRWRTSADENEVLFKKIEKIYLLSQRKSEAFEPNVDRAWLKVANLTVDKRSNYASVFKIAAMIVMAFGLAFAGYQYQINKTIRVVFTTENEVKKIALADGSVVWLNENTRFEYPVAFADDAREVLLDGQAYFEIAKNPKKEFSITGGVTKVSVLGTSFDLVSKANYTNVNVTSGRVSVSLNEDASKELILVKGQRATYNNNLLKGGESFESNASSWMTNNFVFKSTPLSEVADILSKHFDVVIKLDEAINKCLITSSFENKNLEEILGVLKEIAAIKVIQEENEILLTGPGC